MLKPVRASHSPSGHRFFLRRETQAEHLSVERAMSQHDPACPAGYRRFLRAQWRALAPCEQAIDRLGDGISDWDERRRGPSLLQDLERLGISAETEQRPPLKALSPTAALGLLYVLEGSRLGGQLLARRLDDNPSPECRKARHFLDHGHGTRLWPSFVAMLEATSLDQAGRAELLGGATLGFAAFTEAANHFTFAKQEAAA